MSDISKATPRPWMVGASWGRTTRRVAIYPETPTLDQLVVAEARGGNPEANAALIVRAVNAYDAMREALAAVYQDIDLANINGGSDELNIMVQRALQIADA